MFSGDSSCLVRDAVFLDSKLVNLPEVMELFCFHSLPATIIKLSVELLLFFSAFWLIFSSDLHLVGCMQSPLEHIYLFILSVFSFPVSACQLNTYWNCVCALLCLFIVQLSFFIAYFSSADWQNVSLYWIIFMQMLQKQSDFLANPLNWSSEHASYMQDYINSIVFIYIVLGYCMSSAWQRWFRAKCSHSSIVEWNAVLHCK